MDATGPDLPPADAETKRRLPELLAAGRALSRPHGLIPHPGPVDDELQVAHGKSGALRAAIFGVNDGLVSNVALIMGFAGASQPRGVIVLAGISGLLAGAFSMGAGEYLSMRVQRELLERVLHLEAHELGTDADGEREELAQIYMRKGLSPALASEVAVELMRDPAVALDTHAREELGIDPDEGLGSPLGAAASSFTAFCAGAIAPLAPFVVASGTAATVASLVITAVSLLLVGGLTSRITGRPWVRSAARMCAIGMGAAAVTYGAGVVLGVSVID